MQLWGGQGSGQVGTVSRGFSVGSKPFTFSAGQDARTPVLRLSPHGRGGWVKEEKVGPFYILPPALPTPPSRLRGCGVSLDPAWLLFQNGHLRPSHKPSGEQAQGSEVSSKGGPCHIQEPGAGERLAGACPG